MAPDIRLVLPPPGDLGRPVEAVQLVTARHGDDVFVFEARLSASANGVLLVATDSLGRRAMRIGWTNAGIDVERAPWLPDTLHPENIMADLVLLYWPEASVRRGLAGGDLVTGPGWRSVRHGGAEAISVTTPPDPFSGEAHLTNSAWHYDLDVRSALVSP